MNLLHPIKSPLPLLRCLPLILMAAWPGETLAQGADITGLVSRPTADGGQQWSIKLQTLLLLTSLAFLPAILRGVKKPTDCKLFGTVCTPDNPMGSCMVSSEGACAAYWTYGRFRTPDKEKEAEPA